MTFTDIEDQLRNYLIELTLGTPLVSPDHPRDGPATTNETEASSSAIGYSPLRTDDKRPEAVPKFEPFWRVISQPSAHQRRGHLVAGISIALVIVAGLIVAVAYGPRSSDVGGSKTDKVDSAHAPAVSTTWAIPTPSGYVELRGGSRTPVGVQTLNDATKTGIDESEETLRRAGWRSGIAEFWAPKTLVDSGHGYTLNLTVELTIDQFNSSREATAYQAKSASLFLKTVAGGGSHIAKLTFRDVSGAVADSIEWPPTPAGTKVLEVFVEFHRGPYVVALDGGTTNKSSDFERFVEHLAEIQFGRLPR